MKHLSRKWLLVVALVAVSAIALFLGKLTGGQWVSIASILTGSYHLANVMDSQTEAKCSAP